jgi:periplasmic protein TonB
MAAMFPVEKEMMMSALNEGVFRQSSSDSGRKPLYVVASSTRSASRNQIVFAGTILEEDPRARGKRAAQTGLALAIQAAIVGALLVAPLIFTEGIDLYKFNTTLLVAPPPPAAPPPMVHAQTAVPKQSFIKAQLTAPTVIPKRIVEAVPDAGSMAPAIAGMAGGVPGGVGDVLGGSVTGPPPPPPVAVERPKGPIRIFSGMKEPRLLYEPPLVYSPVAMQAHVSGTVILEAIIDEHGNVTQVQVISGAPLLLNSAIKAVAGRKYEPTILDGQPVSIRLSVKMDFRLRS